jgi:hypothetical protein
MPSVLITQVFAQGPDGGVIHAGEAAHLSADCVNQGTDAAMATTVTLALSDGQQGGQTVDLQAGESRSVAFDTTALAAGSYELTVTATDASGQALADNGLSILVQDAQGTPSVSSSGGESGGGAAGATEGPAATTDEQRAEGPKLELAWGDSKLDTVDVPEIGSGGEGVA